MGYGGDPGWLNPNLSFLTTDVTRDNVALDLDGVFLEGFAVRFNPCAVAVEAEDHSWWLSPKVSVIVVTRGGRVWATEVTPMSEMDSSLRIPIATTPGPPFTSTMDSWTLSDVLGYISICCWLGAQFPSVNLQLALATFV